MVNYLALLALALRVPSTTYPWRSTGTSAPITREGRCDTDADPCLAESVTPPSDISPATKVATLLRDYPHLEELLISMSPAFVKLRNPVLRRSVARVAALNQAASVGRLDPKEFVNELRVAAGLEPLTDPDIAEVDYFGPEPDWFDRDAVTVVVREDDLDPDVMPINPVLRLVRDLRAGEILELVASHLPAPGIDILRRKGYRTWTVDDEGGTYTFITPKA